jgi:uncharacterized membrane protein YeaQ/YmgE (transglycosylase-associated protein family)
MHLSNESLIVIILVGVIAGWLAGNIVSGGGYGLIGDLIVGVIGAFIGDRLLPRLWRAIAVKGRTGRLSDWRIAHTG